MFKKLADENLVEITGTAACCCGEWKRIRVRKHAWCKLSRRFIAKGDLAWTPLNRTTERDPRIADSAMTDYLAYDAGLCLRRR
jgi:hypothetical protein